jgi:hypothetical protein
MRKGEALKVFNKKKKKAESFGVYMGWKGLLTKRGLSQRSSR